jgi:shikimate kinase
LGDDVGREGAGLSDPPAPGPPPNPHLILIGLPGSGKSSLGRKAARQLGVPFLDLDAEIERREGRTIAEIFAGSGEPYFREREHALTRTLRDRASMVLAPGGGWAAEPHNPALLRPPGRIIYLRVSPRTAVRRMGFGIKRRPLLAGPDPVGALEALLERRAPVYATADVIVETERRTQQQILAAIREVAVDLWGLPRR